MAAPAVTSMVGRRGHAEAHHDVGPTWFGYAFGPVTDTPPDTETKDNNLVTTDAEMLVRMPEVSEFFEAGRID
jgi:hypothetical protein